MSLIKKSSCDAGELSSNTSRLRLQPISEEQRHKEGIGAESIRLLDQVYQNIRDIHSKAEIQEAVKSVQSKELRIMLIDKLINRVSELHNSDEFLRISRNAMLVSKFASNLRKNKFQKDKKQPANQKMLGSSVQTPLQGFDAAPTPTTQRQSAPKIDHSPVSQGQTGRSFQAKDLSPMQKQRGINISQQVLNNLLKKKNQSVLESFELTINYTKVSDMSEKLISQGKSMEQQKTTQLLRDQQKLNLAAYFKSQSIGNLEKLRRNTFILAGKEIQQKLQSRADPAKQRRHIGPFQSQENRELVKQLEDSITHSLIENQLLRDRKQHYFDVSSP